MMEIASMEMVVRAHAQLKQVGLVLVYLLGSILRNLNIVVNAQEEDQDMGTMVRQTTEPSTKWRK